jgi:hypothetical protein
MCTPKFEDQEYEAFELTNPNNLAAYTGRVIITSDWK